MAESDTRESDRGLDRRKFLTGLGAAAATGLSGCGQGGQGGQQEEQGAQDGQTDQGGGQETQGELGERVPPVMIKFWSNVWTSQLESMLPVLKESWAEVGITLEFEPQGLAKNLADAYGDNRTTNWNFWFHTSRPDRLDSEGFFNRMGLHSWKLNWIQYDSCEFTDYAYRSIFAPNVEKRRELKNKAFSVSSEDRVIQPIMTTPQWDLINTEKIEPKRLGRQGVYPLNPNFYAFSDVKQGETVQFPILAQTVQTLNFPVINIASTASYWNVLVHSPPVILNHDLEHENVLAKSVEIEDEATRYTIELVDGATHHDGTPITGEDLKFTYDHIFLSDYGVATFPLAARIPLESAELIDDMTVQFNFSQSYLPFRTTVLPLWGVLNKKFWLDNGATETPENPGFDTMVGSGPFKVSEFKSGQLLALEPHDGHPWDPSMKINFPVVAETQTQRQMFKQGELHSIGFSNPRQMNSIQQETDFDAMTYKRQTYENWVLQPQMAFGPQQFKELRDAAGAAINRKKMNALIYNGEAQESTDACIWPVTHPRRPPDEMLESYTDKPEGDPERARRVLEEAGWGWDDDGNLHYPPDYDPSPRFPKGERPPAEEHPCLDDETGEYIPPSQR